MIPLMERTVFLKSLNYLRVSHPYSFAYTLLYPVGLALIASISLWQLAPDQVLFGDDGFVSKFSDFLAVIAPFFIAALAAVSTFKGPEFFDKPMEMKQPVILKVSGERGAREWIEVTPRHFLSLLLGYCSLSSLALFLVSIFAPVLVGQVSSHDGTVVEWVSRSFLFLYLFVFFR